MAGVQLEHVVREYTMGRTTIRAVDDISFTIPEGKYTIIWGPAARANLRYSTSWAAWTPPPPARVTVNGREISGFNKRQLTEYRRESIGFVFQFYNLMPNLTVLENVELASQICKNPLDSRQVLAMVGLGDRLNNFPAQCSGGEQQRGRHRPCAGQESRCPALRRTHWGAGLPNRKGYSGPAVRSVQKEPEDRGGGHPQRGAGADGGRAHSDEKRKNRIF